MADINERIQKRLFELQDLKYRDFNSSLIPTVEKETVIGVRTPQLRKLAKELSKDPDIENFMRTLPHKYYEENNLHGLIIEGMNDFNACLAEMNLFLPYIDNWATCDIFCSSWKFTKADADGMVAEYVRMYNELTINGALPQKIEEQQKIIDMANRKKNKLLQLAADDSITNADFKSMTAACNEEIRAAEEEIAELEQAALEGEEFRRKIDEIRKVLANAQRDAANGVITKEFVDKYIDKIFITPTDENTLLLQIKIFTGETTEKYLRKFEHRVGIITGELTEQQENQDAARGSDPCVSAGHTFKKMIEAYENNLH